MLIELLEALLKALAFLLYLLVGSMFDDWRRRA